MANKITDTPCPLTDIFYLQRLWPQQSSRLLSPTRSDQFSAECVCHLAEEAVAFWKKPAFVWKPREMFSVSLPPQKSNGFSFCSRGSLEEWREGARNEGRGEKEGKGWMDSFQPSPLSAIFSSVKEDASELCKINWGLFSYEMQTEGKVITMTFRTSLKSFLHLLVGPSGLFSSLSVTNKYLIDVQHCLMCCTALGLQPTWKVTVTVVKLRVLSQKYI